MIKKNQVWLLGVLLLIVLPLVAFKYTKAQTSSSNYGVTGTVDSSDAIAVRVIPNPNHYSITRWYEAQGFEGSPQALIVDGYEAIRDGRTVYVNAANIDSSSRTVYTNIYLISYNQDPAPKTVDILGQIVSHWKFNNNIVEYTGSSNDYTPSCSVSAVSCAQSSDCATTQYCATSSAGIASSSCLLKAPKNCLVDTECPNTLFCSSVKAKITRDIKRVGLLEELKEALYNFKNNNKYYPRLSSGTYLANNSLSVWPSWNQSLLSEVAVSQSFTDPVNRLGLCPGYDAKTCWNPDLKKFVYNPTGTTLTLPSGSYAFAYSTDANGSNYNLCAVMESRAINLNYHFSPNDPASSACVTATGIVASGQAQNTAPQLVDKFLIGLAGKEFSGFLKVIDLEGNPLKWSISGQPWLSLMDTSDPTQKKVYASSAPTPGDYGFVLTVTDGQGGTLSLNTSITILADAPRIEAADAEYVLDQKTPFNYNFTFSGRNIANSSNSYTVTKTSGAPDVLNGLGLTKTFNALSSNDYKVVYNGIIPTANKFYRDATVNYRINIMDRNGVFFPKTFSVKIIVEQPQLNLDCASQTRVGKNYACLIGLKAQGNHSLSYTATGLPLGLSLTSSNDILLNGSPSLISPGYPISIKATNEYGASTTKSFALRVDNYCGDGLAQSPNTEGRGGIYNDGYEDCDGSANVVSNVSNDITRQYGCRTLPGIATPYPILTNSYCVFKSPIDGGGYCGDTYCQASINGQTMETCNNCPKDCGDCPCIPQCTNKSCGADNCGEVCGFCKGTELCNSGNCCPKTANIQTSVDNHQTTYFNGSKVNTTADTGCGTTCATPNTPTEGCCWAAIQAYNVDVVPGKNVIAIWAQDKGGSYGLAATLNQAPCNSMTTSETNNWKCVKNTSVLGVAAGLSWIQTTFDDSAWPAAVSTNSQTGNALAAQGVGQIWADGAGSNDTIYCRYTFYSEESNATTVFCPNGKCDNGETCDTCSADCGTCAPEIVCGDATCEGGETCSTCPADCGTCITCAYTYSSWGTCQSNNTRSRSVLSSTPSGCTGVPVLSESCVYTTPSPTTCTYTYSSWGACQSNDTRSRSVLSSTPSGCTGVPVLSESCVYIPPTGINCSRFYSKTVCESNLRCFWDGSTCILQLM